ncbi:MAG: polysaccharide deacetylase family protein [Oscillospiraceae bacterium]|nr:polysaccharide deacetylase family protein [Oscillospiraceae bacterium]
MPFVKKAAGPAGRDHGRKEKTAVQLSPVRRIDRVAVQERICAMTFDDGPCRLPASPDHFRGRPLTQVLAEILERYGARGTFNVVGDTSGGYPDKLGKPGSPFWNGAACDHFPAFRQDDQGGAVHCPELISRLLAGGHEIASHSYTHLMFGRTSLLYSSRKCQPSLEAVVADLRRLHKTLEDGWGYPLRLSRPPRCVDVIKNGFTSYDAFALMGYQYLAASFDGAGCLPQSNYQAEVEAAWRPMERLLLEDPDAFRGQIITQQDGFNMACRTPVADGLENQLRLLTDHGYKVVTVSELLERAPFRDVMAESREGRAARRLLRLGWCVAFQDNTLRPDTVLTRGELAMMAFGWETVRRRIEMVRSGRAPFRDMGPRDPYAAAAARAMETGAMSAVNGRFRPEDPVSPAEAAQFCAVRLGRTPPLGTWDHITHGEFFTLIAELLEK